MTSVARRVCGATQAADVVQDVFVRMLTHSKFDPLLGTLGAYLCMVTHGVAVDRVRSEEARRQRDLRDYGARASVDDADVDGSDGMIAADSSAQLRLALDGLPTHERNVIQAAFFESLAYRDVATMFGIPEGTAKSRIRSGLRRLRIDAHLTPC